MASVNKVILIGNCGRDPEVRYLPSGQAVANVSIATSSRRKDRNTGETVEAVDGTELLKSLSDSVANTDARLEKSFGEAVSLMKSMHGEIASRKKQVAKLSGEGRGRKAVVNVHEHAEPMAKSQSGLTPNDLMAKAQAAFAEGRLSGRELNEIDASLRMREAPNPSLIAKALA